MPGGYWDGATVAYLAAPNRLTVAALKGQRREAGGFGLPEPKDCRPVCASITVSVVSDGDASSVFGFLVTPGQVRLSTKRHLTGGGDVQCRVTFDEVEIASDDMVVGLQAMSCSYNPDSQAKRVLIGAGKREPVAHGPA